MTVGGALQYSQTIGFYGLAGRGFNNPVDVAVGKNEVLYVLNRAGPEVEARMNYKRVTMCNLEQEYLGTFGSGGSGDGQMMWPCAIVADQEDRVYISDESLHRISIFDKDGQFLSKWGSLGNGDGQFNRPAGLAFDLEENLLVADGLNHRIQRYTRDGRYISSFGSYGNSDGQFNLPWGICIDRSGDIYVADWRNDRIQKFDHDGAHLATWGTSGGGDGQLNRPSGVSVDYAGNIYVADWGNERIQILGADGTFRDKLRGQAGMSKWGQDYLDSNAEELEERGKADLEPEPNPSPNDLLRDESAAIEKLFWGPVAVEIDPAGRLYVVESCRHRIQIYQT